MPVEQVDHWTDVDPALWYDSQRSNTVGRAQMAAFSHFRVGAIIAGLEVPHCHVHVVPISSRPTWTSPAPTAHPTPAMDDAAERLRAALRELGHGDAVPA